MKSIFSRISLALLFVCFDASVFAAPKCLSVQGTLDTQAIVLPIGDDGLPVVGAEQVGVITMIPTIGDGNLIAFKKAFGQVLLRGGIHGVITDLVFPNGVPTVVLNHEIGFPGVGALISTDDNAIFIGPPDAEGNIPVKESGPVTANDDGGAFVGWTGNFMATGTIGTLTGTNAFLYQGELCKN